MRGRTSFHWARVVYEMATGRRAFGGDDLALIAMRIVNGILVSPRTVNPDIPEDVEAIILKLMATDPNDRYQTAAQLLADVRAALLRFDPDASSIGSAQAASGLRVEAIPDQVDDCREPGRCSGRRRSGLHLAHTTGRGSHRSRQHSDRRVREHDR